jgi:hypothetical protein
LNVLGMQAGGMAIKAPSITAHINLCPNQGGEDPQHHRAQQPSS